MEDLNKKPDWGLIAFLIIVVGSFVSFVYGFVQAVKFIYQLF